MAIGGASGISGSFNSYTPVSGTTTIGRTQQTEEELARKRAQEQQQQLQTSAYHAQTNGPNTAASHLGTNYDSYA